MKVVDLRREDYLGALIFMLEGARQAIGYVQKGGGVGTGHERVISWAGEIVDRSNRRLLEGYVEGSKPLERQVDTLAPIYRTLSLRYEIGKDESQKIASALIGGRGEGLTGDELDRVLTVLYDMEMNIKRELSARRGINPINLD